MKAAVLALLLVVAGCGFGGGPHLHQPNYGGGISDTVSGPGEPFLVGSLFLCLDGPGEVTIDQVRLVGADPGMKLTGFAVRPNPNLRGGHMIAMTPTSLAKVGLATDRPAVVDIECQKASAKGYELVVEVVRTVSSPVGSQSLLVRYHNDDESGEISLDLRIGLGKHEMAS